MNCEETTGWVKKAGWLATRTSEAAPLDVARRYVFALVFLNVDGAVVKTPAPFVAPRGRVQLARLHRVRPCLAALIDVPIALRLHRRPRPALVCARSLFLIAIAPHTHGSVYGAHLSLVPHLIHQTSASPPVCSALSASASESSFDAPHRRVHSPELLPLRPAPIFICIPGASSPPAPYPMRPRLGVRLHSCRLRACLPLRAERLLHPSRSPRCRARVRQAGRKARRGEGAGDVLGPCAESGEWGLDVTQSLTCPAHAIY
ncbi:hypothetical protein DFH09DRAFT_1500085 [Mycena vulgaris]|nr:hypothetical protein DFH09DRAFT_1500085 [Mycena vulgaris]